MNSAKYIAIIFLVFIGFSVFSQDKIELKFNENLDTEIVRKKKISFRDSTQAEEFIKQIVIKAHGKG